MVEADAQDQEAAENALQTEEVAATAMKAAERAVREEMEAAAVTKETKKALEKAITDLKELGISFAEVDDQAASKRAKLLEQNKVRQPIQHIPPPFQMHPSRHRRLVASE